jgi:hypothetical protein
MHVNVQVCFCKGLCRNDATGSRPKGEKIIVLLVITKKNSNLRNVTHVQTRQTIPTKHVLASFTHHLGTAFILLDWNGAHWTTFYQIIVEEHHRVVSSARLAGIFFARY